MGSTRLTTDANGVIRNCYDYLPFGEALTYGRPSCFTVEGYQQYPGGDSQTVRFTGKERDAETGLDYFGARYMSAAQGRFTSPDVINVTWDRLGNPSNTLNKYAYAANNPLKYIDPDGQDITLFYRESEASFSIDFGHAFLAAHDPQTRAVDFLDYFPKTDERGAAMLQWQGLEMVGPGAVNTGDFSGRRSGYASLTIQTTPEVTQKVMAFIREFKANPPSYRFPSHTCVTACRAALEIAGIRVSAYSPSDLWSALVRRYSPGYRALMGDGKSFRPAVQAVYGVDAGSPRNSDSMGFQHFLFNLWLNQMEAERKKKDYEVDMRITFR